MHRSLLAEDRVANKQTKNSAWHEQGLSDAHGKAVCTEAHTDGRAKAREGLGRLKSKTMALTAQRHRLGFLLQQRRVRMNFI